MLCDSWPTHHMRLRVDTKTPSLMGIDGGGSHGVEIANSGKVSTWSLFFASVALDSSESVVKLK